MKITLSFLMCLILMACVQNPGKDSDVVQVVTTTNILTDLAENIGGDKVKVIGLMGSGVDPHLYKASEGDVNKLSRADIIFYNGLHLEGKMTEVFEQMKKMRKTTVPLADVIDKSLLREASEFGGNYDPHVWFNVSFFKEMSKEAARALSEYSPEHKEYFQQNLDAYLKELDDLEREIRGLTAQLPENKRRLVTAHDAFSYFGREYGFDVVGLQGISTATEAGVQDVRKVTDYIIEHEVRSIFIENSVPVRTIEALKQAVISKGSQVNIGGMLYSDSLGNPGTDEGTYTGMFLFNVKTIVDGLK